MKKILQKENIKYYLTFYIIIEIISRFSIIKGIITGIYGFFDIAIKAPNIENFVKAIVILVVMLIFWILMIAITTLPVTIFLLARKTADDTQERQNQKYTSRENIIYYREKLNGVSPTTISLMQNLKFEEEKDITATIMKLQLNKNIQIERETIKVISEEGTNLTTSEKQLLYLLSEGNITTRQIEDWKNYALLEAEREGYIEKQKSKKSFIIKNIILIIMFVVFCLGFKYIGSSFITLVDELEKVGITEDMDINEIAENENLDLILNVSFQGIVAMICIIGIFGWPIFYIVYVIKSKKKSNTLKRTVKGEKLTDEILGMKRFIHDFSMLNQADKDEIVLWDDFLVYAIVLEENTQIIDEILEVKNIEKIDSKSIVYKNRE